MPEPTNCAELRQDVDSALAAWRQISLGHRSTAADSSQKTKNASDIDIRTQYYLNSARSEAAARRYRTAVRRLSQCLRVRRAGATPPPDTAAS